MPRRKSHCRFARCVPCARIQNGNASAHHVVIIPGGLQPNIVPLRDRLAIESQPYPVHSLQRGHYIRFIAEMRVKPVRLRILIRAVAHRREVCVKAITQHSVILDAGIRTSRLPRARRHEQQRCPQQTRLCHHSIAARAHFRLPPNMCRCSLTPIVRDRRPALRRSQHRLYPIGARRAENRAVAKTTRQNSV